MFPVRGAQEFLGDEDALGEGALELGEDLNPVSTPAPCSLCAALFCCPLLTAAPVPEAAAATVPPALTTPLSRSLAVAAEAANPVEEPALLTHLCSSPKINLLTRFFAGSGNAPPAYLLTTSTTCRMV